MNKVGKYLKFAMEKVVVFCMKLFETAVDVFKWVFCLVGFLKFFQRNEESLQGLDYPGILSA